MPSPSCARRRIPRSARWDWTRFFTYSALPDAISRHWRSRDAHSTNAPGNRCGGRGACPCRSGARAESACAAGGSVVVQWPARRGVGREADSIRRRTARSPQRDGTMHLIAVDARGDLAGCTSTSGLFFKMPGRVGDSSIIGAGCFTDNEAGSAGSTGRGEANILVSGGHLAVEFMRQGKHPREACLMTLERIARTTREKRLLAAPGRPNFPISFYAVNKAGQYAGASMYSLGDTGKRRQFAVADASGPRKEDTAFLFEGRL